MLFTSLWFFIDSLRPHPWFLAIPALTLLPWVFFAPLMTRWVSKRTTDAINSLLRTMAMVS
jgi:hypothetical protein